MAEAVEDPGTGVDRLGPRHRQRLAAALRRERAGFLEAGCSLPEEAWGEGAWLGQEPALTALNRVWTLRSRRLAAAA